MFSLLLWNASFGAFGGLVLCLHGELDMHVEAGLESKDCHSHESPCSGPGLQAEDCEPCLDLNLQGGLLPPARTDEQFGVTAAASPACLVIWDSGLHALVRQPSAQPPTGEYTQTVSRSVTRTVVLRL